MIRENDMKALGSGIATATYEFPNQPVYCGTSQDKRVIDLVAHFNRMDPRGRLTLLRMAAVMPGPKEKEL